MRGYLIYFDGSSFETEEAGNVINPALLELYKEQYGDRLRPDWINDILVKDSLPDALRELGDSLSR